MIKGYAIKKTVYEGADGVLVDSLKDVRLFNEEGQAVSHSSENSEVIEVFRPGKRPLKKSRRNQAWMKE